MTSVLSSLRSSCSLVGGVVLLFTAMPLMPVAIKVLSDPLEVERWVQLILQERTRMLEAFSQLPICQKVYPTDANFFLAKVSDAQGIYDYLVDQGIIVRNRTRVQLCHNCLRITIGSRNENSELIGALRQYK